MNVALWIAVAAAVCAVLAVLLLWNAWKAGLRQAQALEQGRLVEAPEPRWPGLRGLTRSLNATVRRLQKVIAEQAEQVALLQRQAQLDGVSGVPLRAHFMAQLQKRLAEPGGPGVALLLVRVLDLEAMNSRLGHEGTDGVLAAIGDVLLTYVERVPGALAGRLNGCDFALCLPVSGLAGETAQSLRAALSAAPAMRMSGAEVAVAGTDGLRDTDASAALATADAALARAEALWDDSDSEHEAPVIESQSPDVPDAAGARAWRAQIAAALAQKRVQLAEFSVVDREGREIHLECPLRVQLREGGDYQAAGRWLALARRSRLLPQVDLTALELALQAIALDGRSRAVHAAAVSLVSPGFIGEVARRLAAAPHAARALSIECVEGLRPADILGPLAEAAAAWRPFGVRMGIEHAGATPQQLPALKSTGIAYVKVDARHLRGAATDSNVRGYAQSLVALLHGLGLATLAEGIEDAQDLAELWTLGFDGATGPAVSAVVDPPR